MRVLISGTKSGAGKTTIVCGLLWLLKKRGIKPSALKCGPDYIDPMFHREVLQIKTGNIDLYLSGESIVKKQISHMEQQCQALVMEGAMGYFDGIGFTERGSAYEIAAKTNTNTILIADGSGCGRSLLAVVKGFLEMDEKHTIKGIILNHTSKQVYEMAKPELEKLGLRLCGYVPKNEGLTLKSRHLGLVKPDEIEDVQMQLAYIADCLEETLDLSLILELMGEPDKCEESKEARELPECKVAVAKDEAFCFCYEETIQAFYEAGLTPVFFSPLKDEALPEGICGIYLCGGYPELYLEQLSGNQKLLNSIRKAYEAEMPMIAECGGFLYLQSEVESPKGDSFSLAGIFPGHAKKEKRLQNFGYGRLKLKKDCLLGEAGTSFPSHSFHYYSCEPGGKDYEVTKESNQKCWEEGYGTPFFYGAFPHLYFYGQPKLMKRWKERCMAWKQKQH